MSILRTTGYDPAMRWAKIVLGLLVVLVASAFVVQNGERTTELSFDVVFAAWKLSRPIAVPALMGICVTAGAVIAWAMGLATRVPLQRRVRQLEQENALRATPPAAGSDAGSPGGWS